MAFACLQSMIAEYAAYVRCASPERSTDQEVEWRICMHAGAADARACGWTPEAVCAPRAQDDHPAVTPAADALSAEAAALSASTEL